jgi:hypothetical protein
VESGVVVVIVCRVCVYITVCGWFPSMCSGSSVWLFLLYWLKCSWFSFISIEFLCTTDCGVLGSRTVKFCTCVGTFRRNTLPPAHRLKWLQWIPPHIFEDLTVVNIKVTEFWYVTPCSLVWGTWFLEIIRTITILHGVSQKTVMLKALFTLKDIHSRWRS